MTEQLGPTASRIMGIARQLFMQRGYRAVSISDIVTAADITKPTLYYHFSDKEDLFVQMSLHMMAELHTQMDAVTAPHHETAGRLTALVRMIQTTPDLDSRMMRQEAREHLSAAQQQRIATAFIEHMFLPISLVMRDGLTRRELRGASPEELTMLFLCTMEGFHYQNEQHLHVGQRPHTPLNDIRFTPEAIVQFFLNGVGAPAQP